MRTGDWIQTYSGRVVYPLDPRKEDVFAEDIGHSRSLECRFGGHCRVFYSDAEHSVRVARVVSGLMATQRLAEGDVRILKLAALLHDASGTYLKDIPRPLKHSPLFDAYRELEKRWQSCINQRFALQADAHEARAIKQADEILLATERRDLMFPCDKPWDLVEEPLVDVIIPWHPGKAKREFLAMLGDLYS